jgi:hypothetical protein
MNRWLNKPERHSVNRQFFLSGQSAESSFSENPARTLTVASCRVTSLQPIAQSNRLKKSGSGSRRGSRNYAKQFRQPFIFKMVQKQIGDDNFL